MGCGSSKGKVVVAHGKIGGDSNSINGTVPNKRPRSRPTSARQHEQQATLKANKSDSDLRTLSKDTSISNGLPAFAFERKPLPPPPKSVAFDVTLDSNGNKIKFDHKKLPSHLKTKLAPLENAPRLTAQQLAERQNQAEQNRIKELEKKKEISKQSSRLRSRLLAAKEFDQQQYRDKEAKEIEEKQMSAGKNREARKAAQEEKKRLREERAKRVKARAEQVKKQQADQTDLGFEIEKDEEGYNDDDNDSWLGDDEDPHPREFNTDMAERLFSASASTSGTRGTSGGTQRIVSSSGDRVYSGRESPHKRIRGSAEMRARASASTMDSYDLSLQRQQSAKGGRLNHQPAAAHDDFFDT